MNDKMTVADSELMPQITSKVTDPVCQMQVDPAKSAGSFKYKGATLNFCSTHCLDKIKREPDSFVTLATPQNDIGTAPPGAGDKASSELADMTRLFWMSVALKVPLVFIEMSEMIRGQPVQRAIPHITSAIYRARACKLPSSCGRDCRYSYAIGNGSSIAASTCSH
jgi:YHS domain-containing protein